MMFFVLECLLFTRFSRVFMGFLDFVSLFLVIFDTFGTSRPLSPPEV